MRRSYVVEILFTLILFTIFVVGSLFILLGGANAYQSQIVDNEVIEEWRLPLSYFSTKLHQADKNSVYVEEVDGINCLVIEEVVDNKIYVDMIYYRDGYLYECYTLKDIMSVENGSKICAVDNIDMSMENGFIAIEIVDGNNEVRELNISLR